MKIIKNRRETNASSVSSSSKLSGWLTYAALLVVAGLAWSGVLFQTNISSPQMPMEMAANSSTFPRFALLEAAQFLMSWAVMMTAMMLPSALPMLTLYATLRQNYKRAGQKTIPTAVFTGAYLALWTAFGLPVYLAWVVIGIISENNGFILNLLPYVLALILIGAGLYQFTPFKLVCLSKCRSPMAFLMGNWRSGYWGTVQLAWRHALYCLGCCWLLMVVLVAAGAMALPWVLLIAALVLVEW